MNFKRVFNELHKQFRSCLQCGSVKPIDDSLFCSCCRAKLFDQFSTRDIRYIGPIPVHSLFLWRPDENRALSVLLENLKGNTLTASQNFYSNLLLKKFLVRQSSVLKNIIIPAPARQPQILDHAGQIAAFLSQETGWPMANPFSRIIDEQQKHKNRIDRSHIRLQLNESFSMSEHKNTQILFVDDIVTTGSTVLSAYKTLGCPRHFQILSWADRRLAARA